MHSRGADRRRASSAPPGGVERRTGGDDRRRHGFISRLQIFSAVPYELAEAVLAQCAIREVAAGEVLLEPGQANSAMHLLVSGRLRIHFDDRNSGNFIAIEEGGSFGELSIIDGQAVSAYVVADVPSRVMAIDEGVFWERLASHPGVARNLMRVLSERMRHNRDLILERMKDKLELDHLQKELGIARDLQLSMLPDGARLFPERSDVEVAGLMEPARNVGGDFYDAFFTAPNRLFLAVGDVSGKGIPAALYMVRAITQMRLDALRHDDPAEIMASANRALCARNEAGMFVTLFCAVLDTDTGELRYANAGHNPPLACRPGHATPGADFLPVPRDLIAGVVDSATYRLGSLTLRPDEALVLYTDGVTEAMNAGGEFYGDERFLEAARRAGGRDAHALADALRGELAAFTGAAPQADDITLLCVRYKGSKAGVTRSQAEWL